VKKRLRDGNDVVHRGEVSKGKKIEEGELTAMAIDKVNTIYFSFCVIHDRVYVKKTVGSDAKRGKQRKEAQVTAVKHDDQNDQVLSSKEIKATASNVSFN
jgi:hypothetical protein